MLSCCKRKGRQDDRRRRQDNVNTGGFSIYGVHHKPRPSSKRLSRNSRHVSLRKGSADTAGRTGAAAVPSLSFAERSGTAAGGGDGPSPRSGRSGSSRRFRNSSLVHTHDLEGLRSGTPGSIRPPRSPRTDPPRSPRSHSSISGPPPGSYDSYIFLDNGGSGTMNSGRRRSLHGHSSSPQSSRTHVHNHSPPAPAGVRRQTPPSPDNDSFTMYLQPTMVDSVLAARKAGTGIPDNGPSGSGSFTRELRASAVMAGVRYEDDSDRLEPVYSLPPETMDEVTVPPIPPDPDSDDDPGSFTMYLKGGEYPYT